MWFQNLKRKTIPAELCPNPQPKGSLAISFRKVNLPPYFNELTLQIKSGDWVMLYGSDSMSKALFCDLCFSYIDPESGEVSPRLFSKDVSYLGRIHSDLAKVANSRSALEIRQIYDQVLSKELKSKLGANPSSIEHESEIKVLLNAKEQLEIQEAQALIHNRSALIIDTTSDFYRLAVQQGFTHSNLCLRSGKTIFWIIEDYPFYPKQKNVWEENTSNPKLRLYFNPSLLTKYIN